MVKILKRISMPSWDGEQLYLSLALLGQRGYKLKRVIRPAGLLLLCLCASACRPGGDSNLFCGTYVAPTSVNLTVARNSFEVQSPRPIRENGRILLYGNYLYINDPGLGFHIFDNSNPESPKPLFFVNLPGNYDLVFSQGKLYADSYIDLLVMEIYSSGRVGIVERSEAVLEGEVSEVIERLHPVLIRQEVLKWYDKRAVEEACR